jgi:hypothetical protein
MLCPILSLRASRRYRASRGRWNPRKRAPKVLSSVAFELGIATRPPRSALAGALSLELRVFSRFDFRDVSFQTNPKPHAVPMVGGIVAHSAAAECAMAASRSSNGPARPQHDRLIEDLRPCDRANPKTLRQKTRANAVAQSSTRSVPGRNALSLELRGFCYFDPSIGARGRSG